MKANTLRITMLVTLGIAMIGPMPFVNPGCGSMERPATETEPARLYTPEEVQAIVEGAAPAAALGAAAAGQPLWIPFVDIGIRLAALAFAWYQKTAIRKKETEAGGG